MNDFQRQLSGGAAAGPKFSPGAKVVAVVSTPQNQTIAVRFTLR